VNAALPWIAQARGLLAPSELGGLAGELRAFASPLASLTSSATPLAGSLDALSQCTTHVLIPVAQAQIDDGSLSSGRPVYRELLSALTGLAGESAAFDGNGPFVRFLVAGGGQTLATGPARVIGSGQAGGTRLFARMPLPPLGTSPALPASRPPYRSSVACARQAPPRLGGAGAHGVADGSGS
jgi:hypothetical protein